jgi:uncharacterized protein (DUF608 family)
MPKDFINRREFIAATSAAILGAGTAPANVAGTTPTPESFQSPSGSVIPYSKQALLGLGPQRVLSGPSFTQIAFPIGGIGTGTVSIGGRGEMRDWEIFNRPGKGRVLPFTFVALWLRPEGESGTVRVVESQLPPPFSGSFGYRRESAEGLPRFRESRFSGAYPMARVDLEDEAVPLQVSLEAFNPFIPLNVDDSSLPVAVFHYHVKSRSPKPIDLALAFSLLNAVGYDGKGQLSDEHFPGFGGNLTAFRKKELSPGVPLRGLDMTSAKYKRDDLHFGSMALLTTHPDVSVRTPWGGGRWWDSFQEWFDELSADHLRDTEPLRPTPDGESHFATLAPHCRLAPGESKTITFILSWYFPMRENYWNDKKEVHGQKLKNDYATRFNDAWEVGRHAVARLEELERKTRSFHDSFFSSTLPPYVLEAVSSQAAIIRTNTCMLLEGKQFFAFEGCADDGGCCPMDCTHVWNYEQALAFLYPELERFMRSTDFKYNMRADDSMAFRTLIPLGRGQWDFKPAADGQMGCIMKLYREWQMSGDNAFLKDMWPQAKRALEFAWKRWDPNRDGVFEGQQHNTYDIEFYGPNTMMGTLYLGALRAAEIMATAVGDASAAQTYREVREKGQTRIEELWNGEYYIQKVPPADQIRSREEKYDKDWYANTVRDGEIRYQYGQGCLSDQLLGQWFAQVIGLGDLLQPEHVRQALLSIYRHNFQHDFYNHPNTQRIYALNDEKGLLLCSWPHGQRPALPFVYSDEVWTGIEYQVAAHLIYEGLLDEGLAIVKGIRGRYDGMRRNPWNEVECGSHYSRALASWSVLLALSGYRYSAVEQRVTFAPRFNAPQFRSFFVAGTGWGVFSQKLSKTSVAGRLEVNYGEVRARYLNLAARFSSVRVTGPDGKTLDKAVVKSLGHMSEIDLGEELVIPSGASLTVEGTV